MSNVSTLILYKQCKIEFGKNFMVDDISDYLSGLTKITIDNFQYQKHNLELEIKIDQYQYGLEALPDNNYNYVSIQNFTQEDEEHTVQNGKVCYYFVTQRKWRSQNTLLLSLTMDTINTFKKGTDYDIDPKTRINRVHKDRWIKEGIEYGKYLSGTTELNDDVYEIIFNVSLASTRKLITVSLIEPSPNILSAEVNSFSVNPLKL